MHEMSLVGELIEEVEQRTVGRTVALVVIRHASTISEETLRQAFTMLAADGPLANAALECEQFEVVLTCPVCGFAGALDHDHLAGHVQVCPQCGDISGDSQLAEMELIGVVTV
jgi:Zn finger protein HypA/HybF involved in hydrogenase expression